MAMTTRRYLEEATLPRALVDRFLDPSALNWSSHDPVLGYRVKDAFLRYGMDDTYSIFRYGKYGERRTVNYGEMPCRMNTYGDSYTMGSQVNDGETWPEVLAAHLGEPVRNFGVGAYGVYQAYRRMVREEQTGAAAAYVILNIFAGDHVRNIYRWRWLSYDEARRSDILRLTETRGVWELESAPWAHVELDLTSGPFRRGREPVPETSRPVPAMRPAVRMGPLPRRSLGPGADGAASCHGHSYARSGR